MWGDVRQEYSFMQEYEECELSSSKTHFETHHCCCCTWTNLNPSFKPFVRALGRNPVRMTCPNCLIPTETKITWVIGKRTRNAGIAFSLILCCCIPYCSKRWKIPRHHCKYCHAFIALGKI